jgi:hypothetical protein
VRLIIFLKAKSYPEGTIRTWSNGDRMQKVGSKWVKVSNVSSNEEYTRSKAESYFDYAMTTNLGWIVEDELQKFDIFGFEGLTQHIADHPSDEAHRIYKQIVDRVRREPSTPSDKKAALDFIGRSLIELRNQYAKPKATLTIQKKSSAGKNYSVYKEGDKKDYSIPSVPAKKLMKEQSKLAGWNTLNMPTITAVRKMVKSGQARVVSGDLVGSEGKFYLEKKGFSTDAKFDFRGDALRVQFKQKVPSEKKYNKYHKIKNPKNTKKKLAAVVEIDIPYAFVHKFLEKHVPDKAAASVLFRLTRSQGYIDYFKK